MGTYEQICHWIEDTFPYYKSTSNEWKVRFRESFIQTFYYSNSYKSFLFMPYVYSRNPNPKYENGF